MHTVFEIFKELKLRSATIIDGYSVAALPIVKNHRLGISSTGQPMFFIRCDDATGTKTIDSNLEFISVQYNRECQLLTNDKESINGIFTVISLKTDSIDLQEYFLEIVFLVVRNLAAKPKWRDLKCEVEKLINLFSKFSMPPVKTIQGLWAELLVIEKSRNPEYLVRAWHKSMSDKFDFNDGVDKIEVKSTSKSRRVHTFSLEQLNPNENSNLIVVSVFAIETGVGKNIFDLVESIEKRISESELAIRINEILADSLGKSFEKAFDVYFDYQLAIDSIQYYRSDSIPTVEVNGIPKELTNVHFDSDLTDITALMENRSESTLHKSLF